MTLTEQVVRNIIKRLVKGQDYRIEIVALINAEFLQFAIDFFKKVIAAKLASKDITVDWYKEAFLNTNLSSDEIAINSGLNKKTITNMYNSATKEIVIGAANEHYDILYQSISKLIEGQSDIDLTLTVKFRGVSVDLNINESLIVINTLAVKRSSLRGGAWASAGKQTEKILMIVLCKIFQVDEQYYSTNSKGTVSKKSKRGATADAEFDREIDFFLVKDGHSHKCEVKLMGAGNSESADAVIARDSDIFVGDKLSDNNKKQLDSLNIQWVELRNTDGYMRFVKVLEHFSIPHKKNILNLDKHIDRALDELFIPN
jgi:CfrBI restriction endonuclease